MSASIKKKSKPKSDKVATNNNKQQQTTNNKRPFFLPKINKVFLRPILQNLKGRSVLDKFFFENDPLGELNQMPPSKKFYLLSKLVKNAKWWSKSSLPLSHSTAKFFPLKKGFKKYSTLSRLAWNSRKIAVTPPGHYGLAVSVVLRKITNIIYSFTKEAQSLYKLLKFKNHLIL